MGEKQLHTNLNLWDHSNVKHLIDAGAAASAIGTLFSWMPNFAAFLSVCWFLTRFYEYVMEKRRVRKALKEGKDVQEEQIPG